MAHEPDDRDPWDRWGLSPAPAQDTRSTAELTAELYDSLPKADSDDTVYGCRWEHRGLDGSRSRCSTKALPHERYCSYHLNYLRACPRKTKQWSRSTR